MNPTSMLRLAARALASGGRLVAPTRVEWDLSGDCQTPVGRDLSLNPASRLHTDGVKIPHRWGVEGRRRHTITQRIGKNPLTAGMVVGLTLRCRKCDKCRAGRKRLWAARAQNETAASTRTWFGTLTLSPQSQFHYLTLSRAKLRRQGVDFDQEDHGTQFRCRVALISSEITKLLKRVRKNTGCRFRYLWVCERHKSGDPHFHCLIHEISPEEMISHRDLTGEWGLGFTKFKLVKSLKEATYLTKYLAKSGAARVRSSLRYGQTSFDIAHLNVGGRELITSSYDPLNLSAQSGDRGSMPLEPEAKRGYSVITEETEHGLPGEGLSDRRGKSRF